MKIGVPKEIKTHEYRVGLIPHAVAELCRDGHNVVIERGAGVGAGFADVEYESVGAELADSAEAVFEAADLIVKVKEPQASERALLNERHTLFTYLHLAPDLKQTTDLLASGSMCRCLRNGY